MVVKFIMIKRTRMKIKTKVMPYDKVASIVAHTHKNPKKPNILFRTLVRILSIFDLAATHFRYEKIGMERLGKNEPCLILMNHSSFIDLKIASKILYPRPFNIVCTSDGFVGKNWLMRQIGCIPTKKFVAELGLIKDMKYALKTLGSSVLMYPEASYSFDGTATPLPESLGSCLKMLDVPVVMIRTEGAFARDPLYNNLQLRKVNVSATVEYILSPDEIKQKSAEELNAILAKQFSFDNFRWQQENGVLIKESFRADFLNRALYKCPHCLEEGKMIGKGTQLRCEACGEEWELTETGFLKNVSGETKYDHVPDWYAWERDCVRRELERGEYSLDAEVEIGMMVDMKAIYMVGEGRFTHDAGGFHLTGCDGKLDYSQKPLSSYSLYADYYWYELGDMICIGNHKVLYYCFPRNCGDVVAKTRLAAEELYKLEKQKHRSVKTR